MEYTFMIPRGKAEETGRFGPSHEWKGISDYLLGLKQGGTLGSYHAVDYTMDSAESAIVAQLTLCLSGDVDQAEIISTLRERYGALTEAEWNEKWKIPRQPDTHYNIVIGKFGP